MKNSYKVLIAVSLVVGLIALGLGISAHNHVPVSQDSLGGVYSVNTAAPTFASGFDIGALPVSVNWAGGKIGAKSNTAFWKNTTNAPAYIDLLDVGTDGVASSSFTVYAYASTSAPRTLYDFGNPAPQPNSVTQYLIAPFTFATSSAATTTWNNVPVRVPANSYLDIVLVQTGAGCTPNVTCETSTSTSRGFNMPWRLEYHN